MPPPPPPTRNALPPRQNSDDSRPGATSSMQPAAIPQRMRNDESWVEIASQPSSSSLSSIGDEIVTTGLRVQNRANPARRRRNRPMLPSHVDQARHAGTSSQEEYDESESDDDHVMTSSNEHVDPVAPFTTISHPPYDDGSDSDDDDENATALGRVRDEPTFTPQPNAFSHPPSSNSRRPSSGSYFPSDAHPSSYSRPTYPSRVNSRTYPAQPTDHDAALRASLTTLLSCAAAARGLPKRQSPLGPTMTSNEPMGLRLVPESELMGGQPSTASRPPMSPSPRARSSPSISSPEPAEKSKRKAATTKSNAPPSRATKKKKVAMVEETLISPTLLAWAMSAGVVVLVSVVGFGAGYVIGREVGQREALAGLNGSAIADGSSCGREAVRSTGTLRRFKWGTGVARSIVA
ncbi:hypothetical protein BP6252_01863 [Coleophoma cylindrospora]|uniref:Uncharacterized protein n=1 Tax=Coleophoma cylindrospora TaxID=1849047 RepID=A0A3D8SD91_9HELO|nr:hypothetical protein BP6252_01863 [Coleophoma cylindrospora]